MPPKRAPTGASSQAKKSRASTDSTDGPPADLPAIPRNKRWAPVSASGNADDDYKLFVHNPVTAYNFVCMCQPPFLNGDDDDEDDDDEDDDDEEDEDEDERNGAGTGKRPRCDGGDTCLCEKPAAEHPDHVWKLSAAGKRKFFTQRTHEQMRCPDNFNMYTFNDHMGYGILELLQNLVLDFSEAAGNYKEQWAVCEGTAFFLKTDLAAAITRIDDGETVDATFQLIGRLFLSMLATLERENLLGKDSPIPNLGLIMAIFMTLPSDLAPYGLLDDSKKEAIGPAKDKKKWQPHTFHHQILAYARKYDIDLVGPHNIADAVAEAEPDADLPAPASNTGKADPFGFAKGLKAYTNQCGGITGFMVGKTPRTPIGGDTLDITTWTSDERKRKSFDKKDPLGKAEIDAIKNGLVMSLG
ncbi:hypothetical protein BT67DRAFT_381493 [Trichocladium antarcticum]|uniref:Uncharacterized protein n=1 Tax=Trichocladium antarcticum TaxID=1450529 RepID=A0AAN6ZD61_9PEZI|nr:hypothetical protein BT67DRAFT_381493 [Trichocladium antarcticum]